MESDEYLTLSRPSEGYFSDLRSKFLSFARHVDSAEEATGFVAQTRNEYHDARHVAYAYILGYTGETYRASDDGEPSGTAGRPILGQMRSAGLTFTAVCVVRYFGGVKLGTSRLTAAYKAAAADALAHADMQTRRREKVLRLRFAYERMGAAMRAVREADAKVLENGYADGEACLRVAVRLSAEEDLRSRLDRTIKVQGDGE